MVKDFALDAIDPNPWQPRLGEDDEHVASLAASIAEDGLMQVPTGRMVGERVQLAFGHSRLAAYKLLRNLRARLTSGAALDCESESAMARAVTAVQRAGATFEVMPVQIAEIDDESMYRFAVSENVQRRNLDAIEEARSMQRAMQDFGYTSKRVGDLFGKSESTVRGLTRLLDLPEQAQEKVRAGEISQGAARKLLAVATLVNKDILAQIALGLAQNPGRSDQLVSWDIAAALERAKTVRMNRENAGDGLWPLGWTFGMNMPTGKDALAGWKGPKYIETVLPLTGLKNNKILMGEVFSTIAARLLRGEGRDEIVQMYPAWGEAVDYLMQIANPPPCSSCARMARHDGTPYCGMKACFERKRRIWREKELEALSKETGIGIYDDDVDGAERIRVNFKYEWSNDDAKTQNAANRLRFERADPTLRLGLFDEKYTSRDWLTNHVFIGVFDVSAEAHARLAAETAERAAKVEYERNREANRELEQLNREQARKFLVDVALSSFAVAFAKFDNVGVMMALARVEESDVKDLPRAQKISFLRRVLAERALSHVYEWRDMLQGPVRFAEHLQGVAASWGVNLPEDWLDTAARFANESVAVETADDQEEC